ncbi:MAG: hypothetical protein AABX75_02510 [Nanoarchaeota archaeon]
MKTTISGIAIVLMLLLSTFSGAVALAPTYQVPVATYDTASARLNVDSITVKDASGSEVARVTSTQVRNLNQYTFVLPAGEYKVIAEKATYRLADADIKVELANLPVISLKLAPLQATPPPANGGTDNTGNTGTTPTASNGINIKDLDFEEDAKPNADVEFTVELKNLWVGTDGKGIDAREVNVNLVIKGIDDGEDVEEDIEFGMIDYKDTESQTVKLTVPVVAEEGRYDVVAKVTWENGETQVFEAPELKKVLNVERDDNAVAITDVVFESDTVRVGDNSQVAVTLANIGKHDEDVKIKLTSSALGLQETSPEFALRESKQTTQYLPFELTKDVKSGKYALTITAYFADGQTVSQTGTLEVEAKAKSPVAQAEPVTVTAVSTVVQETTNAQAQATGVDTNMVAGFIAAILILLAVAAVLGTYAQPKPVIIEKKRSGK